MSGTIEYSAETEAVLAFAVSMGRAWLVDKKRYDDVRQLDEAINNYKKSKKMRPTDPELTQS